MLVLVSLDCDNEIEAQEVIKRSKSGRTGAR